MFYDNMIQQPKTSPQLAALSPMIRFHRTMMAHSLGPKLVDDHRPVARDRTIPAYGGGDGHVYCSLEGLLLELVFCVCRARREAREIGTLFYIFIAARSRKSVDFEHNVSKQFAYSPLIMGIISNRIVSRFG